MTSFLAILSIIVIYTLAEVNGHSWLACTDYAEKNAGTWDPNKCRGFPRQAYRKANKLKTFGLDTGYDYRPGGDKACNVPYNSQSYTSDHPMAVYYPGQQVVLVHPMKNHGADVACGSIYIPDTGSWLFGVRTRGQNNDPTLSTFRNNLIFDLGRSPSGDDFKNNPQLSSVYPKSGYANAPRFCDNTDKALATYSFNVPRNLSPGIYTFVWMWSFNSANDRYTTCFEVKIVANRRARNAALRAANFNDLTEPCGGLTSNHEIMGNSNPGCTRPRLNVNQYAVVPGQRPPPPPETTTTITTTTRRTEPAITTQAPDAGNNGNNGNSEISTSRTVHMNLPVQMMSLQFSGEIDLPTAGSNVIQRHVGVDFSCPVEEASFWNALTVSDPEQSKRNNHFDLVQQGSAQIKSNYIFYHVSFLESCDLSRHPPLARLTREELRD